MEPLLLFLAMALLPIYSFASGGVQYSHVVIAVLIAVRLIHARWNLQAAEVALLTLLAFIIVRESYSIFVENIEVRSLLEVLYIAFAFLVLVTFSRIELSEPAFQRALRIGLIATAAVAVFGIYHYGATLTMQEGALTRSVGTFNNPNQLAYFSICVLSLSSLMYLRGQMQRPLYILFLGVSVLLSISAISKAGLIAVGTAVIFAVAALLNRNRLSGKLLVFCALLTLLLIQLYAVGLFDNFYFVTRLEGIGSDHDDSLTERGYLSPLIGGAFQFLFGRGEAKVTMLVGHEVHSTYWSYLLKYGLVGFTLFLTFWYQWTKRIWNELGLLGVLLIVAPASFYGITHNGSRFAIFWILVGVSFNTGKVVVRNRGRQRRGQHPRPLPMPLGPVQTLEPDTRWQGRTYG
jgi:hypothetical protein